MIMSLKQREIKFKPRIKLNHNIYLFSYFPYKLLNVILYMLGSPVITSVSDFYRKPSLTFLIIAFTYASHGKFITPI